MSLSLAMLAVGASTDTYVGQAATVWSIRLALLLYLVSISILLLDAHKKLSPINRWIWTCGCIVFLIHVGCAFQFVHHWSHIAALQETAKQTLDVTGIDWGGGLYFNYLFGLIWLADVIWWWKSLESHRRRHVGWEFLIHGYFLFIAFNATIIFENGWIRWIGIGVMFGLLTLILLRVSRNSIGFRN